MADLKDWQDKARAEKAVQFGEIGFKSDCVNGSASNRECIVLNRTICESRICHFYNPSKPENSKTLID